jgi:hypothetical protein
MDRRIPEEVLLHVPLGPRDGEPIVEPVPSPAKTGERASLGARGPMPARRARTRPPCVTNTIAGGCGGRGSAAAVLVDAVRR